MSYNVTPLKKYSEISYRVKCVTVENERVFGDVFVTQQTRDPAYRPNRNSFSSAYRRRRRNLIQETLDGPDFMELNSKRPTGSAAVASSRWQKRSKSIGNKPSMIAFNNKNADNYDAAIKRPKIYPSPMRYSSPQKEIVITSLVDQLLLDIYGIPMGDRGRSESDSTTSSLKPRPQHQYLQKARLLLKSCFYAGKDELQILLVTLHDHIIHTGGLLIRQLRRKDYLTAKRDKQSDIITAYLQAHSAKRFEDTKMRFNLTPQPGESGFIQWLDAMKMVARLQGGIPPEFRKRLWLTLAERHLEQRGVDWKQAEKVCFNEWSNPDDEELGIQIVKDLHRTGCSLFCGAAGRDNQAVLRRVLLGFARWNKSVGYCQGLNVLAALVLQVMDRAESSAVKVMIYLIEGVLPEGYFADNLRGLSVDMAVFRDLLRSRLPKLSKHLEALQSDAKDKATGSSYEPPLTNVFTMQWFLTLFCHCLPQEAVLRVWDLIFLEGDEVLLRTALAIWEGLSDRIMTVTSADEFYSIMGVLTREMLEFTDTNNLIKNIVGMGPLHGVTSLREKHRYNITPWARKLSDDDDSETEEDERLAVAAAMFSMAQRIKKDRIPSTIGALQAMAPSSDRERLALDISTLKQQYAKLRERQRQAHIILSAACARQTIVPPPTSTAMNHLLVGKNALVSGKNRPLSLPSGTATSKLRPAALHSPRSQNRKERQGVTLHWKDAKRPKQRAGDAGDADAFSTAFVQSPPETSSLTSPNRGDSDSDSTSTELCDEPDRLSDVDSEEPTSASDSCIMATDDEKHTYVESSSTSASTPARSYMKSGEPMTTAEDSPQADIILGIECSNKSPSLTEISIAKITDQIRRLSAEDDNNITVPQMPSARGSDGVSTGDYSVEKSQAIETKSKPHDLVDYTSSENTMRSSSKTANSYDYLSLNSNLIEAKADDIPVVRTDRLKDVEEKEKFFWTSSKGNTGPETDAMETTTNIWRDSSNEQSNVSLDRNYDKFITSLDTNDKPFESPLRFSCKVYLNTQSDNNTNIASSEALETTESRHFYSKKYVVGHLPISPITMDNKLTKLSHEIYKVAASPENLMSPEVTLKRDTFIDKQVAVIKMKSYSDSKKSPKTPESAKSFSSGETMGPDSKPSSLTASPRTPNRSDSRDLTIDKSACSSISSDSKTLVLHSVSSDIAQDKSRPTTKKTSYEKSSPSTPISTDSLRNKCDASPKLAISSSSDSCSPSKVKSSERSFSSDLQSPVSANSIRYTSTYGKRGQDNVSESPIDLSTATSPFYPIANPNQKTPSPYGVSKRGGSSIDSADTSPDQKSISSKDSSKFSGYQAKLNSSLKSIDTKESREVVERSDLFVRLHFGLNTELDANYISREKSKADSSSYESIGDKSYRMCEDFADDNTDDQLSEKDVVPQLPHQKIDKYYLNYNYRRKDRSRSTERSSSSLETRPTDLKSSVSTDEFGTTMAKKRSSDILENLKHLEAKAFGNGSPDSNMLTKKSSDIWEDMKNLEARRQDTFSNSASSFLRRRLEIPDINITGEGRKSYVVHPKINIDENSDSILKSIARNKNNGDMDDGRESKVGVWTKVKPRKKSDNGRRSSDRALKIIQENSAILHKILACQAKKRLPDLEEISKEITISPINEEISKIFSPILEKMGLNEHEINEELARINFKDFDNMSATSASEFDAKINEELSKLSLIDNVEQIDHPDVDEIISGHDYLDTREALIDHKINEELSRLLANYEEESSPSIIHLEEASSSQNISETEGLDLTSISTNVFSYKSSNDSIEARSDLEIAHEATIQSEKFPFATLKYEQSISPKSDIDIYRELEKLDKISTAQVLPDASLEIPPKRLSPITYVSGTLSYPESVSSATRYTPKTSPFDAMPPKSTYELYKSFDFPSRLSPRDNLYTAYDKPDDSTFKYTDPKRRIPIDSYDAHPKDSILSKESLEFRVRYDDETPRSTSGEYAVIQDSRSVVSLNAGSSYYSKVNNKTVTPTKYISKEEKSVDVADYSSDKSDLLRYKYNTLSPKEYSHVRSTDYNKPLSTLPQVTVESEQDIGSYLPIRHRDYNALSPNCQYRDQYFPSSPNHYTPKVSPSLAEEAQRPATSHPESPGKISIGKYGDPTSKESNCYKKSTLSFGNMEDANKDDENVDTTPSPRTQFSPFPVRNNTRKPKELTLKLGLYLPKSSDFGQLKKS